MSWCRNAGGDDIYQSENQSRLNRLQHRDVFLVGWFVCCGPPQTPMEVRIPGRAPINSYYANVAGYDQASPWMSVTRAAVSL